MERRRTHIRYDPMNTRFILNLLFGNPAIPEWAGQARDLLPADGLAMTNAILGRQGSGKTFLTADHLLTQQAANPRLATFVLDWSGSLTDTMLQLVLSHPQKEQLLKRIVYDDLGGRVINQRKWVMPHPEFHADYDPEKSWEERVSDQVARVTQNMANLNYNLVTQNPTLGGIPVLYMLPNVLRLVNAIPAGHGGTWQITEVKRLLRGHEGIKEKGQRFDPNNELWKAVFKYGGRQPEARDYFLHDYQWATDHENELRTNSLRNILRVVEADDIRARVGAEWPGYTPKEAIDAGLMVLIDGSKLITREAEQNYLFELEFSLIRAELNKRRPNNPDDGPIALVFDDAFQYMNNPAISMEIAELPSQFRSRKLRLYLVLQTLSQLAEGVHGKKGLRETFWTIGNIVVFSLLDFRDAMEVAEQFFPFDPFTVKVPARSDTQHPIMENRDEQKALLASRIQNLEHREFYIRRFLSESRMDHRIKHIRRTREMRLTASSQQVDELKDELFSRRAVDMRQMLEVINHRTLEERQWQTKGQGV